MLDANVCVYTTSDYSVLIFSVVGYYLAAFLIDHKLYGRKRMQAIGFIMSFILFIIAAGAFPILNQKGPGAKA